ncbi:MAG TPA: conjugal transfer protein TrbL family protein [Chloroflexota bacterium]
MTKIRLILLLLLLGAVRCGAFPAAIQASSAGLEPALPVPSLPVTPNATAKPATGAAPQTVVINSGPSMDQLKQETPGLFQSVLGSFLGALDQGLTAVLNTAASFNFLTRTPPELSYAHPDILRLWAAVRAVTNAALALIALVGGYNVILHRRLGTEYAGTMEFLPRLAVGALLANTSMWWASAAIDANNALCAAIGAAGFPGWGRLAGMATIGGVAALWTPARLLLVLALLLYLVMCLLLVIQMLMRLALVDVLLVLAPLGLLCWILPQTQRWARLWSTTFVGVVFTQFIQVVAMLVAGNLLTAVGAGAGPAGTALGPFMGLAALVLILKLPGLVGHQLSDGWGTLRGVLVGQVVRGVAPGAGAVARATSGRTGAPTGSGGGSGRPGGA